MEDSHGITKKADLYASRRLREVRESMGLSQPAFGARIGMKKGTLSAVEVGRSRVSLGKLAHVAKAIGVPLSTFIIPDDDPAFVETGEKEETVA